MRTKHFISNSILQSSFYEEISANSYVGKGKYHQSFYSVKHTTNVHTNIYLDEYTNKGTEEKINISAYDKEDYLNEIQVFEVKPYKDQVLSFLSNCTALEKISINKEKRKFFFHSYHELMKRTSSICRPSNYNLLSII